MGMKKLDATYWSPLWRHPTITSFGHLFPHNYDGPMLDFWRRQIGAEALRILDLACGNGALSWIANDITEAPDGDTRITGVDIAEIDPFKALGRDPARYPRVRFLGSTRIEALPLPDGAADLAISQYGVEYSDLEQSIPEIGRVLAPSGRLAFILHDRDSVIVRGATEHLGDFRQARDEIRLPELLLSLDALLRTDRNIARLARTAEFRGIEARAMEALYAVKALARAHPPSSPLWPYAERLGQALHMRAAKQAEARRDLIHQAARQLESHIERAEDLWLAALPADGRQRLVALVQEQGFVVTEQETLRYKDGDNFGTLFAARRGG